MNMKCRRKQRHEEAIAESANGEKPQKELLFMVYPPNKFYSYYHYKNGFRAWGDIELGSKIAFFTSLISLLASIIAAIAR